jgi:uncharacterized protein with HEPN domain
MPKRNIHLFVLDIFISIDRVKRYSSKLHCGDELMKDEALCSALLRELEIIGEAMNRILQTKELTKHIKPTWRDIVDFRNIAIHEYFGIDFDEVYAIVKKEITLLEKEMIGFLKKLWAETSMQQSFEKTLDELRHMERNESVKYLARLQKAITK